MALLPKVKLKTVVSFPAAVLGGAGIAVRQENGNFIFDLDWSDYPVVTIPSDDLPTTTILTFNTVSGSYLLTAYGGGGGGGGIPDAPNDGVIYGRQSLVWSATVTKSNPAFTGTMSLAGQAFASSGGGLYNILHTGLGIPALYLGGDGINYHRNDQHWFQKADGSATWLTLNNTTAAFLQSPTAPTPALGDNSTKLATTAFVAAMGGSTIGKAINGLLLSNNATTPNSKLDLAPGNARDKDLTMDMKLVAGTTFSTSAFGVSDGALDTGAVAANTGYHVHLIYNPTTLIYKPLISMSPTAPLMPSGYTKRRRIGGFITDASGFIYKGLWRGDGSFELIQPIIVVSARSLTLQSLLVWPVPLGVKLKLKTGIALNNTTGGNLLFYGIMRDPDIGVLATDGNQWQASHLQKLAGATSMQQFECWTSTSGTVYTWSYGGDANNQGSYYLLGWLDLRDEFS